MHKLNDILISVNTQVVSAIRIIDTGSVQIALVVDEDKKLLGTVTDGDVRRGILKGIALTDKVEKIMNPKPVTAAVSASRESILALMRQKQLHQIPVLDEQHRVVDIEILDDLISAQSRNNVVVLMAGGLGNRLRPLTADCPKPLLPVGGKPLMETILENFCEYGFTQFYFAVHYKDEMIRSYFGDGSRWKVKIDYIHEEEKLGTAGALTLLPIKTKDPIFIMNADLLTKVNFQQFLNFHQEHKSEASMCVREYDFQVPYGVVKTSGQKIMSIDEKPIQRFFVNAGIYLLEPEVLKLIPKKQRYDMTDLFTELIRSKRSTSAFPIREYWLDIGRFDDLERARHEFSGIFK
ncbi:MAG: alcohol dehydrogenase [Omnitrophica bacterium GWA2_52_8]|nr:MAG: alcohol dehydrogenase [Omnitrophica bacterium GWA2_52_8]